MLELVETDKEVHLKGQYHPSELMVLESKLVNCLKQLTEAKDLNLTSLVGSDSGLIALLLSFQRFANRKHWQVNLINASDGVKGLIELSQMKEFFTFVDTKSL